jgi:RNA-dependent RNA polymerase
MELFMSNVNWTVDVKFITVQLARLLHAPNFYDLHPTHMNFHVYLFPDKTRMHSHSGKGILTLPDEATSNRFMELFGTKQPQTPVVILKKTIWFARSNRTNGVRRDVAQKLLLPYMDPYVVEERQQRDQQLDQGKIPIQTLQFGWECRDYVFSVECETQCQNSFLGFSAERRELRIILQLNGENYHIAMNYSQIREITVHESPARDPVILFILHTPPTYERDVQPLRKRLSFLPIPDHERVCPYASLAIRLVCTSLQGLQNFRNLSRKAQLHRVYDYEYPIEYRGLFSSIALETLQLYLSHLDWRIVFQIEAIVRGLVLDVREMLEIMHDILRVKNRKGSAYTAALLLKFRPRAQLLFSDDDTPTSIQQCFLAVEREMAINPIFAAIKPSEGSLCDAYHVTISPTTITMDGPFPERSNRVIRAYDPIHQEAFLRVSFLDEAKLQYRFDREVDARDFIRTRVGPFLLQGLTIAGRRFEFLAYSQSALKEHAVWCVFSFLVF